MTLPSLRLILLQLRLVLSRFGWGKALAILLGLLGLGILLWEMPRLQAHNDAQRRALQRLSGPAQAAPPPASSAAEQRYAAFQDILGDPGYPEQALRVLFAIATRNSVVLSQAEYKWLVDANGRTTTYQILLPVNGPYENIRQFCKQILLAIPFASLDEVSFKRDEISNLALEAKLRLSLHFAATPGRGQRFNLPPVDLIP